MKLLSTEEQDWLTEYRAIIGRDPVGLDLSWLPDDALRAEWERRGLVVRKAASSKPHARTVGIQLAAVRWKRATRAARAKQGEVMRAAIKRQNPRSTPTNCPKCDTPCPSRRKARLHCKGVTEVAVTVPVYDDVDALDAHSIVAQWLAENQRKL